MKGGLNSSKKEIKNNDVKGKAKLKIYKVVIDLCVKFKYAWQARVRRFHNRSRDNGEHLLFSAQKKKNRMKRVDPHS